MNKRTWFLIAAAVFAIVLVIAVPLSVSEGKKGARTAVAQQVDGLRAAVLQYQGAFGDYVAADAAPRSLHAVDDNAEEWLPTEGFRTLSWSPDTDTVHAAFQIEAFEDGFTITGSCDLDGDGQRAVFKATLDKPAHLVTEPGIY